MASFGSFTLTDKGRDLLAKAQTGVELNFTRIAVGDGQLGGTPIASLNALISEKKSLAIGKLRTLPGGKAVVGTAFSNQDVTTGFYYRELGVFAQDPDLGEILYCYANAGDGAEYIAPGGGAEVIEKYIDAIMIVGNATNVSAEIDGSLIFVSTEDFDAHKNAATLDHPDGSVTDAKIGNRTISDTSAPTGNTGTPTTLWGWLAYMIKAITGKANWRTAPATTLENAAAHINATSGVHGATSAANANTIVQRDANGRFKAAAPSASDDVARKAETDAALSAAQTAQNTANAALPKSGGTVTGRVIAELGFDGAYSWGTFSSSSNGNTMIAQNAYLHPTDGTYRYRATHTSIGSRGIVFLWSIPAQAAVPHWFDTGRIATTADATFTPTLIPIITSAGNQTINGRIDIGNFAYISNDGTNEFAVFGADPASGGGNRLLLAATDLRVGLSVAASNSVWHTGNQGNPSTLQTSNKTIVGAINELFTSASNGKNQIAAAITGKGVPASGSETFAQLASKISQIVVGKPFAQGQTSTDAANVLTVSGLSFRPTLILCRWYYTSYFQKVYLEEYYPQANRFYQTFTSPTTASITYDTDWTILENGFVVKLTHPSVLISWYAVGTGG